jgi:hypothetical protein
MFSIPYALVTLNLAAAHALFAFLLGSEKAAWRGRTRELGSGGPARARTLERN